MKQLYENVLKGLRVSAFLAFSFTAVLFVLVPTLNASPPDKEMCSFLERFHGHTCPGSLMGLRLGLAAKDAVKGHGKIEAKTFNLACSVDGIQVATGATFGNKRFTLEDRNEMYLILTDADSGRQVEARMTQKAMDKGKQYQEFSIEARNLTAGSPEQLALKKQIDEILDWYRTAPDAEVVIVRILE